MFICTVHLQWMDAPLHLPSPRLDNEQAKEECKEWAQDVILYENEGDMLCYLIHPKTVIGLLGNSGYDIPIR